MNKTCKQIKWISTLLKTFYKSFEFKSLIGGICWHTFLFIPDLEKEFRGLPSDVDVAVGSSVVLSCQAPKGNPSPSVSWKKDGKVYHVGEGSKLDGSSLVINSESKNDVGEYQCQAENIATIRETPAVHLGVHGKHPIFQFHNS